ncbi:MAG: alpha/beta fold hydrolase [Pseudomonadota bacterium]|nr:MAG: triacylglycerol lipase [Pseudomonadota bacterium]
MTPHHVILVPGFFGFGKFGEISYFHGVREALGDAFARLGVTARITEVSTLPTASIRHRAARVLETLAEVVEREPGPVHLVGHSTGGLDARLAIAPTASLPTPVKFTAYDRVRSIVTVCCPHFGTPIATYFTGAFGRWLLRTGASYLAFMLDRGRIPLKLLLRLGYWIVRLRDPWRKRRGTFDQLYEKLLDDLSEERRSELIEFLRAISADQSLLFQLTPAACDLLNACTAEPQLRYGSVIACARRPTFRSLMRSMLDLYTQLVHPAYWFLYRLAASPESRLIPEPAGAQRDKLLALRSELPTARDSDGIVPVHSQIWGSVLYFARADHLDVVGQYGEHSADDWTGDWIPSYSEFDRTQFLELWAAVAAFIAGAGDTEERREQRQDTARTASDLPGMHRP